MADSKRSDLEKSIKVQKSLEQEALRKKLYGDEPNSKSISGGSSNYSKSQMDQIREQIMRVSQDSKAAPIDEDEEFRIAEQLASSFDISCTQSDVDPKELVAALQRSHNQLVIEKRAAAETENASPRNQFESDTLSYSITNRSRAVDALSHIDGQAYSGTQTQTSFKRPSVAPSEMTVRTED